ncbi:exopolysaccharide biosynthesis polyprenyl glycosylphosphotransferase [Fusobacterium sp. MFO224]|uniref:exopolysaccharide biosynthesis polyprenyl glycosylphosphotransferase n=1 Tax=Fusobacterium sp. MFO224 TaxID=3378070 RepID=UPI0038550CBC
MKENIGFGVLVLLYYIYDVLNFDNKKYESLDFLYSLIINFFICFILFFINKNIKTIYIFSIYTIIQNICRYLLVNMSKIKLNILIVHGGKNRDYMKNMSHASKLSYNYLGYVSNDEKDEDKKRLGSLEDIDEIIKKYKIDRVIFKENKDVSKYYNKLIELKLKGIMVINYLEFLEVLEEKIYLDRRDELWVLKSTNLMLVNDTFNKRIKRLIDLLLALLALILLFPFLLLVYIAIKIEREGPVIYKQLRVGQDQKEFYLYKFRSMVNDAEKHGAVWARENDNRVTKIGKILRKTRIDELPQLVNIIKGDMSLIGPRPERKIFIREIEKEVKFYNIRHVVKPGVTGWAQVMYPYGASIEDAKNKLEYDLYYIKYQNFILDIVIIFKTLKTVILGKGR